MLPGESDLSKKTDLVEQEQDLLYLVEQAYGRNEMIDTLNDREIDVYVNDEFLKTIKRHVRRSDPYYPTRGTIEVQKRQWVKVHAISPRPHPRWRLDVERNPWLDAEGTIRK